ncbi:hypothetical protein Zmor_022771 [Zophobas morio]|uniref:Carboxylic ester hydrolase n=1 Tax=Zophobas morio TaxID=2755281 RepID=A0AA38M6Y3_9CUCU|nr:hypothetical protein Zmor_022771 [Zophobas morio]
MFWIHGGVFILQHGGEELHSPDFLITEDVVVVTHNYRLGLLGFISFDDPSLDIPGNAGFKDQVMALKWVQENIDKFGGDPNDVTIFGQSAGAVSVHLIVLSPLAKGLFHKAIAQSGSAINPWVQARKGVKRVAEVMGLEGADDKTVFDTLTKKSKEEILGLQEIMDDNLEPYRPRYIGLVIETNSKEPFMTEEPINIMKSGNFSQLLGVKLPGVCHCDDVFYLFKNFGTPKIVPGSVEDIGVTRFVGLWTNFAKFGNPTPDKNDDLLKVVWKPITDRNMDCLEIGKELQDRSNPVTENLLLWKHVFAKRMSLQHIHD